MLFFVDSGMLAEYRGVVGYKFEGLLNSVVNGDSDSAREFWRGKSESELGGDSKFSGSEVVGVAKDDISL
jgi:hypothetical protein